MGEQRRSRAGGRAGRTLGALLAAPLVALALSASAIAGTSCGKRVVDDWWDNGRVDRTYPLNCYEEAIDSLPVDVKDYSSAEDDIRRALQFALQGKPDPGGADPSPADAAAGDGEGEEPGGAGAIGPGGTNPPSAGAPDADGGPVNRAIEEFGPSSADSVPIPLLVLAGLALVLLAAGSIGYVTRRVQARRIPPSSV